MGAAGSLARRGTLPIIVALGVGLLLVLAGAMYLYDHSRRDVIANGIRVDGVPVGGMKAAAARSKLSRELAGWLRRPVTVRSGSREWVLRPQEAHVRVDVASMVDHAVSASREGSILTRTFRGLSGAGLNREIPPLVSYSHHAVRVLAGKVAAALNRPPRDANVKASASGLSEVPGEVGRKVQYSQLGAAISRSLVDHRGSPAVAVPVREVRPAVSASQLAARYPSYIVIDRGSFRLRFYRHLKLARTYEIAVGMEGLETPAGLHKIEWEQVNPPWYVPKKAWAGALAGKVIPPGPQDPLKARFMSFEGGAGIHGIDPSEYSSIGHNASHGCVRMRIPDVIELYSQSPVGTPVYIV
jgi:lipoprotein-anchoring transpeptidase ErfK/SrfK